MKDLEAISLDYAAGPKCNDQCPSERHTEERGRPVTTEAGTGAVRPQGKETWQLGKLGEVGIGCPLEAVERAPSC